MFSCTNHTVELYDRGGKRKLGNITPLTRVRWERVRDDTSVATAYVQITNIECNKTMAMAEAGRAEMVIFRGGQRVWEGPVTHVAYRGDSIQIEARDITHYLNRTAMHAEYDSRYPNNEFVITRLRRIFTAELARKEALDPSANILSHVVYRYADDPKNEAGTASRTLPYEMSVFDHLDNYASRGGIDYTVAGRSLILFDVHQKLGQTPLVTSDDFIGEPVITQYGMELATRVIMTDGEGHYGDAGGIDPYYGEWEVLYQAYDEDTASDDEKPPSVKELASQAKRTWSQGKVPPMVVRLPENTRVNPNGVLSMSNMIPGTWVPLTASLPGRKLTQMQKIDSMSVEETEQGEEIKITMSPAPLSSDAE